MESASVSDLLQVINRNSLSPLQIVISSGWLVSRWLSEAGQQTAAAAVPDNMWITAADMAEAAQPQSNYFLLS